MVGSIGSSEKFLSDVSSVQEMAVAWLVGAGCRVFQPREAHFFKGLKRLLFIDAADVYSPADGGWPMESERTFVFSVP